MLACVHGIGIPYVPYVPNVLYVPHALLSFMSLRSLTSLTSLILEPDLTDRVYSAIQQAIIAGDLSPGSRLTQEELAEKLAVSRQPVLQALRLLKRDGFVVDAPSKTAFSGTAARASRGLMVSALDAAMIRHVYQVRAALDALAARQAAGLRAQLPQSLIKRGRKAALGKSIVEMIDADVAFHDAIYAASGNPLISESAHRHWHPIRRAMGAVLRSVGARESAWDEHDAIMKAIARGDDARAERLMREHGERAGGLLAERIAASAPPNTSPLKQWQKETA